MTRDARVRVELALGAHYFASLQKEKTKNYIGRVAQSDAVRQDWLVQTPATALFFAAAAKWSGVELSTSLQNKLRSTVIDSPDTAFTEWGQLVKSGFNMEQPIVKTDSESNPAPDAQRMPASQKPAGGDNK